MSANVPAERHHDEIVVPRPVIWLTLAMILFTILSVSAARAYGVGLTHEGTLAKMRSVSFRFTSPPIGETPTAIIAKTLDGRSVLLAKENEEIFPRLILRSVANIRLRDGVPQNLPVQLVETNDGQRLIVDRATHRTMRLAAFGPENQAMFDPLFGKTNS